MNDSSAIYILQDYRNHSIKEIGEVISFLKNQYKTYNKIAKLVDLNADTISNYHKISKLPEGIIWKIEERIIPLNYATLICSLKDADDQWLLAFAIIEAKEKNVHLTYEDCKFVVNEILSDNITIEEALSRHFNVDFDEGVPMVISFDFIFRHKLSRSAWNRRENWSDLVYNIVNEWLDGRGFSSMSDLNEIYEELIKIAEHIKEIQD